MNPYCNFTHTHTDMSHKKYTSKMYINCTFVFLFYFIIQLAQKKWSKKQSLGHDPLV